MTEFFKEIKQAFLNHARKVRSQDEEKMELFFLKFV